jgi:hypothetical protein
MTTLSSLSSKTSACGGGKKKKKEKRWSCGRKAKIRR